MRIGKNEKGAVLVEFALVSLILYVILAATVEFGRMFLIANILQSASQSAAIEFAKSPSPACMTGSVLACLQDPDNMKTVYDPTLLVLDQTTLVYNYQDPMRADKCTAIAGTSGTNCLPDINEYLLNTMISDSINGGLKVLRYPGAVLFDAANGGYYFFYLKHDPDGTEVLERHDVLELSFVEGPPRTVHVTLNFPYQAAALSSFRVKPPTPEDPRPPNLVDADGNWAVYQAGEIASDPLAVESDIPYGPYSGTYGLGKQLAFAKTVRPFRSLLSYKGTWGQ